MREDHDAGIDDVGRTTTPQEPSNGSGQLGVEWRDFDVVGVEEANESHLAGWIPPDLSDHTCGHHNRDAELNGSAEQGDEMPVVPLKSDERAGVKDQRHRSKRSAAARSAFVMGPPDSASISPSTIARLSRRARWLMASAI